ncbi:alternative splicing regulator-domain-containing protein [Syncephalastrum racemosum]|uniref:Alternative splicing regulator-domain-containing protein n=1 Tax=Syncephalastrum racemosum TaxID=13706 RepID=A0A1X2H6P2_SYNRA|nr:alternative splicing regulator-domain-containing protein [Syncephalastrum racemosum]
MWHAAKANEKKIKELMIDHKRRAERRRAFYESRMGDPRQLLRVIGSSTKLYPDVDQYYYHANTSNLMPWQGDPDIRIDRFDGRALLEYLPDSARRSSSGSNGVQDALADELNFERYHDLVEAERLEGDISIGLIRMGSLFFS